MPPQGLGDAGKSLQVDFFKGPDRCSGNKGSRNRHIVTQAGVLQSPGRVKRQVITFTSPARSPCTEQLGSRTRLTLPPRCPEAPADAVKCAVKMQGSILTTRPINRIFPSLALSMALSPSLVLYPAGSKLRVL